MTELDRSFQTLVLSWLDCDTRLIEEKKVVTTLKCKVCAKHKLRVNGRKHFSTKWTEGADSMKTSNIRDHANADQYIHAMEIEKREQAQAQKVLLTYLINGTLGCINFVSTKLMYFYVILPLYTLDLHMIL